MTNIEEAVKRVGCFLEDHGSNQILHAVPDITKHLPARDYVTHLQPDDIRTILKALADAKAENDRIKQKEKQRRSAIIQFCWHSYADLDGNMGWPNNKEGDLIKGMYAEATEGPNP